MRKRKIKMKIKTQENLHKINLVIDLLRIKFHKKSNTKISLNFLINLRKKVNQEKNLKKQSKKKRERRVKKSTILLLLTPILLPQRKNKDKKKH